MHDGAVIGIGMCIAVLLVIIGALTIAGDASPADERLPDRMYERSEDVCTEADGACLTWDDIREQPFHSS